MARTALAVQTPTPLGIIPTFSAANVDGHSIANDGATVVYVKNGGGGSINVTQQAPAKLAGLEVTDPVVAIGAGVDKILGPWSPVAYNQGAGEVYLDFSGVTTVTVAAIKVAAV